jgi:hypothetical protein
VTVDSELLPWLSAGLLAWGLLDCFLGYRVFKVTIAALGGTVGAVLAHVAAQAAGLDGTAAMVALAVGALAGAGLAFLLYLAAVFLAGFGFGATLAVLLLAHYHHTIALLAAVVVGVVGGFAAVKLQKVALILATALLGAFRAVLALAWFGAQVDWLFHLRQPQHLPALIEANPWMLPAVAALAAVGAIAQFEVGGGRAAKEKPAKK